MEENSFSIINRTNGQVTGLQADALPIKLITSISWVKYVAAGFLISIAFALVFIFTAKQQVSVVQVTGRGADYQIFQIE